ncbi:MAG TPA: ABC transporter permease [Thermoanaerobaculia bacterium]|nr:ABC transporter permease [Thermoanaerobaculia bacterium]
MRSALIPILRREYLSRIMTKSFWIATAMFPLLAVAFTVLPPIMAAKSKSSIDPIVIVDLVGDYFPVLAGTDEKEVEGTRAPLQLDQGGGEPREAIERRLNIRAEAGEIQGYVIIDGETLRSGDLVFHARNPSSAIGADWLRNSLRRSMIKYRLLREGVAGPQIEAAITGISFGIEKATNDPKKKESGLAAFFMSFGLVMFIYFALILYGIYVLRGVLEEKSNRIVEIMVSSVKPFDMMLGKILGIGAVGLTQITIWVLFSLLITAPQVATVLAISKEFVPAVNAQALIFFPVYFVLGYFLYATIYAGIGSMFNTDEEAQQLAGVAQLFLVIPMMVLLPVIKDPNGGLATGLSLFPFFTPILMYLRITIETPPAWQIGLSIVIMVATILLMVWLVSKIYRVGILMYGKKPTIPELVRWLRYT